MPSIKAPQVISNQPSSANPTLEHPLLPSIGNWHPLTLAIPSQPRYHNILARARRGRKLLDLGCDLAASPPAGIRKRARRERVRLRRRNRNRFYRRRIQPLSSGTARLSHPRTSSPPYMFDPASTARDLNGTIDIV